MLSFSTSALAEEQTCGHSLHPAKAGTCSARFFGTPPLALKSAQLAPRPRLEEVPVAGKCWPGPIRHLGLGSVGGGGGPRTPARAPPLASAAGPHLKGSSYTPAPPTRRPRPAPPGPRLKPGASTAPRGLEGRSEHVQSASAAAASAGGWARVLMRIARSASA